MWGGGGWNCYSSMITCSYTHAHTHTQAHASTYKHTHTHTPLLSYYLLTLTVLIILTLRSCFCVYPHSHPISTLLFLALQIPQCLYSWFGLWPFSPTLIMHTALLLAIFHLCLLSSPEFSSSVPSPHPLLPKKRPWEKNWSLWSQYSTKESWGWPRVKWRLTRSLFPVFSHVSFRCVPFLFCPTSGALILFLAALVDTRGTFT